MCFRVKQTTQLGKLKRSYSERIGVPLYLLRSETRQIQGCIFPLKIIFFPPPLFLNDIFPQRFVKIYFFPFKYKSLP